MAMVKKTMNYLKKLTQFSFPPLTLKSHLSFVNGQQAIVQSQSQDGHSRSVGSPMGTRETAVFFLHFLKPLDGSLIPGFPRLQVTLEQSLRHVVPVVEWVVIDIIIQVRLFSMVLPPKERQFLKHRRGKTWI